MGTAELGTTSLGAGARKVRLVRPSVVVLVGPAAAGKSTFAARHFRPTQIISSDRCRELVCDDERDQRFQAQAFALLHSLVEQRLSINRLCVVDSTALTTESRHKLLDLARRFRVPSVALVFNVALETCVARDEARAQAGQRSVGRAVIERQYRLFDQAQPLLKQEGFEQIVELAESELGNVSVDVVFRPVPRAVAPPRPPERPGYSRSRHNGGGPGRGPARPPVTRPHVVAPPAAVISKPAPSGPVATQTTASAAQPNKTEG